MMKIALLGIFVLMAVLVTACGGTSEIIGPTWQWEAFQDTAGINDITVVAGYRHDAIDVQGAEILVNENWEATGELASLACAMENFSEALEIGYKGFGEIACSDAAKEGISAFLERRKPVFKK